MWGLREREAWWTHVASPGERMGNEEGLKESVGCGWTKKRRERIITREEKVSKVTEAGSFKRAEETACVSMGRYA